MGMTIGVLAAEHIAAALVDDRQSAVAMRVFPEKQTVYLADMHAEEIVQRIGQQIALVRGDNAIEAIGVGFPGIIRNGVVEDSPNLPQVKGQNLKASLVALLDQAGIRAPVHILNDADAMAAGIAATRGLLDKVTRVWTLGYGIGYGRYPLSDGVGEGGHAVVTLDPKETFCQCDGAGHLEGIMGHRAMRLRFLDIEPEEIFEQAKSGDQRCAAFVQLWHRALAAATANIIHIEGPGKFFISGPNAKFVQVKMLKLYLYEMVKMSPLQGSALEVISTSDEVAVVGAAVSARQAAARREPSLSL